MISHWSVPYVTITGDWYDTAHPGVTSGLDLSLGTAQNGYSGLDQWGRLVDQVWKSNGVTVDEYKYGYGAAGNRLWKQNAGPEASGLDEVYTNDALYRLIAMGRGTLATDVSGNVVTDGSGQATLASSTSAVPLSQSWTLDGLGNQAESTTNTATQARTTNTANEITSITGSGAATPTYDLAGNLTFDGTLSYAHDAWNRQVQVTTGSGTSTVVVGAYSFDGLNRRITKTTADGVTGYYYNQNGQVLEERKEGFGTDGRVATNFSVQSMALQSDGKTVALGAFTNNGVSDFALARYNVDGTLDTSFGTNGIEYTEFSGNSAYGSHLAIQSDGKIVAAGFVFGNAGCDIALARYGANGALDTTFGTGGEVTTDVAGGRDYAFCVGLQGDGKIVVAGEAEYSGKFDFVLARYNGDGSADSGFGTGGIVHTDFGGDDDAIWSLVIQPDGKLLAAGSAITSGNADFALACYNANGTLDTTFGTGGLVRTDFAGGYDVADAVALQPDGKIVVAGRADVNGSTDFALARYGVSGQLDTTFGMDGLVDTDLGSTFDVASSVAIQADGKIVAAGCSGFPYFKIALARYDGSGQLDGSFGSGGCVVTDFGGSGSASCLLIRPDHRIVLGGQTDGSQSGLVYYEPDGALSVPSTTQYVWDISYIDTPVCQIQTPAGGAAQTLYYMTDANHNVTGLVDTAGSAVERYVYSAYGQVAILHGNDGGTSYADWSPEYVSGTTTLVSASPYGNEILYAGYRYDPETAVTASTEAGATGNYQDRNREYSPMLGQFIVPDPMGHAAGDANLYRYCGNAPTEGNDPSGSMGCNSTAPLPKPFAPRPARKPQDSQIERITYAAPPKMVPFGYDMQVNYFFKDAMIGRVFYQSNRFVYRFKDSSGRVRVTVRNYARDLYPVPNFKLFPDSRLTGTGKTERDVLAQAIRRGALEKPLCSYEVRAYAIQGWLLTAPSVTRRDASGKPLVAQYDPNQDNFAQRMGPDGQPQWMPSTQVTNQWTFDYVTPNGLERESVNLGRLLGVEPGDDWAQVSGMEYTVSGKILSANEVSQEGSGINFGGRTSDFTLPDLKAMNTAPNPVQKLRLQTPLW